MKKIWPYILLVVLSGAFVYYYLNFFRCAKYSCISFNGKNDYLLEEEYENSPKVYRVMVRNNNTRIRIEAYTNTSKEEAASYDKIKIMNIESLYETAKSPYPGALSNEIECGAEYRPKIGRITVNNTSMTYVEGYLNERFQLGSCLKDELKYKSHLLLFHCISQQKWYQFEIIAPLDKEGQNRKIIDSITCK
ncbi:MAG: hypothetical protein WAV30_04715 [Microgenomates group bacterium]